MAFRGKMHHVVEIVTTKEALDQLSVADVAMDELEVFILLHHIEIGPVAGIGERIKHDDQIVRMQPPPIQNEVGADEPRAAGYQKSRQFTVLKLIRIRLRAGIPSEHNDFRPSQLRLRNRRFRRHRNFHLNTA
jgi:hypothetical protein